MFYFNHQLHSYLGAKNSINMKQRSQRKVALLDFTEIVVQAKAIYGFWFGGDDL
jgi:hypothetical protein